MPEISVNVKDLANAINKLNQEQIREPAFLISGSGKELEFRKKDILQKKVEILSREQAFDV